MANVLKRAVLGLMEKAFAKGLVLDVRKWDPHGMVELHLHLPDVDMSKWKTIQRLKCKVSETDFEFRDYTPARWDVEKRTCTMYIETSHKGWGAHWADNLQAGDAILYGPAHEATPPNTPGKILCIGDGSALGHCMAMRQLTNRHDFPMDTIIAWGEKYNVPDDLKTEHPEIEWIKSDHTEDFGLLYHEVEQKALQDYTSVFIAGNIPMVTGLRKMFKKNPYLQAKIVAHGFWK